MCWDYSLFRWNTFRSLIFWITHCNCTIPGLQMAREPWMEEVFCNCCLPVHSHYCFLSFSIVTNMANKDIQQRRTCHYRQTEFLLTAGSELDVQPSHEHKWHQEQLGGENFRHDWQSCWLNTPNGCQPAFHAISHSSVRGTIHVPPKSFCYIASINDSG